MKENPCKDLIDEAPITQDHARSITEMLAIAIEVDLHMLEATLERALSCAIRSRP